MGVWPKMFNAGLKFLMPESCTLHSSTLFAASRYICSFCAVAVCATATAPGDVAAVLRAAGRLDRSLELAAPGAPERAALLIARLRERGASFKDDHVLVCICDY